ncbi:MAG: histidinol-phosphatase [Clostridia bacterium]|nr:histidinol-phosphatase [Clostridia bacterium]
MIRADFHTHTTYCDGKNTPEEMVLSAIDKGLLVLGFSAHSYMPTEEDYCIKKEKVSDYINEILSLRGKYKNKINILCGVEMDYFSNMPTEEFDYKIGSVHYVLKGGEYIPIDATPENLKDAVNRLFGGDIYALCEEYYKNVADVINKTKADIIGHIDLIAKFNENGELFDENHPRYIKAYKSAVDALIKHDVPFEVNTGAISRGYRTSPYPSKKILEYIRKKGGRVILNSDSHNKDTLAYEFSKWEEYIKDMGFDI